MRRPACGLHLRESRGATDLSTEAPQDPLDAALRIAAALERSGISYAIGGALAYGLWAVPRATIDVDVNVFVTSESLDLVFSTLQELGIDLEGGEARTQSERQGMFVGRWGWFRIDVFTPSIEFSLEAERTRVRRAVGGRDAFFLSAEAIAVFKLLFFRTKDLADLERLVSIRPELDREYVRRHVASMMGEDDERTRAWDRLVSDVPQP